MTLTEKMKNAALTVIGFPIYFLGFMPFGLFVFYQLDEWHGEMMQKHYTRE